MKCIECPYYSKSEIHGHGEVWRECEYIFKLAQEIQNKLNNEHEDRMVVTKDPIQYIKNPLDECIFLREIDYNI